MRPCHLLKLCLRFLPVLITLICVITNSSAQTTTEKPVSGVIKGPDGIALSGVTVNVKGNLNRTTFADDDGRYRIIVPNGPATLVFSFVGFLTKEVPVTGGTNIDVTMEGQNSRLSDVVVIGYGTGSRRDNPSAIASVNMTDLQKAPVKSIGDALAGRIAGLQVVSVDGQPGATPIFKLRGPNSITGDNSPLFVIDGFPIENFDLNSLNPLSVESIDILKDASATAIYGARGANGVIIVTTKRGKAGDPVVNYNAYYGIQHDINRVEVLSPYEFVKLQLEISPSLYGAAYTTAIGKTLEDYRNVAPIDWYGMVFQSGSQQNHNISISGGTDKTKYSLTGSIYDQKGIIINSGFRRFQGQFTFDQTLSKKFKIGLVANMSNTKTYGTLVNANGGYASFMPNLWGYRPIQVDPNLDITTQLQDPDIGNAPPRTNPFLQARNELREIKSAPIFAHASIDYNITKDLHFKVTGGFNNTNNENDQFNNSLTRAGANIVGSVMGINGSVSNSRSSALSNENTLSYQKRVGDHTFGIVGDYSVQTFKRSSYGAVSIYVPNESLGVSGLDEGTPYSISSTSADWGLQSFLTRVTYKYKSKYSLQASIRADGSSKFPAKNKWGYFPSASISYRLTDEKFMAAALPFITDAKFRLSYGATGNNRVSEYAYYSSLNFLNNGYSFNNATPSQGAVANSLGNPELKWETTTQKNAGLDLELFKGRISLTTDYYQKVTSNLLLNASLPISTGYSLAFKNIGKVSNTGLEFTLNTINISNTKFQWSTNFNISFEKNKVLELTENQESITTGVSSSAQPYYIAKVGHPIAMFYGLIYEGVYQYEDFNRTTAGGYILKDEVQSNSTAALRGSIQPGNVKFKDLNHDGVINNYDFTIIGDPNPNFYGGFTNNFQYKGFDLNLFFQYSYGNQIMNNNILTFMNGSVANTNQFAEFANRWTPTNTNTNIPRAGGATTNFNYSRSIEDGSYIAFKTASLGYTFPKSWIQKLKIQNFRMYVSAQNIFVITNYSGSNPDVSVRDTPLTPGFDFSSYPSSRIFVAGLALTF